MTHVAGKVKSTKQLARELGLLRKRNTSVSTRSDCKKQKTNAQLFSHLIVIDYESTCWDNEKTIPQEIIEFPAVLIDCQTGAIESEFHHYIQPTEHPQLSDFCRQLTGISQDQVDNGIPLSLCVCKFLSWLRKLEREKNIVCADDKNLSGHNNDNLHNDKKLAAFVTWSDWDLGVCLLYEAKRKQILKPSVLDRWIDLRATYRKFYSRRPDGLSGALKDLGINFDGRQHSGLDDARNTAKLAYRMICDGCNFQITKTLKMCNSASAERFSFPLPIKTGVSANSIPDVRSLKSKNCTITAFYVEDSNDNCQRLSACINSNNSKLSERNTNLPISTKKIEKYCSPQSYRNDTSLFMKDKIHVESPLSSKQSGLMEKTKLNKISLCRKNVSLNSSLKRPISSDHSLNVEKQCGISRQSATTTMPFKTPSPGEPKPFVRETPPLCSCGRRSKRRYVQNAGPNVGRSFYSCPINNSSCHGKSGGCKFFRWETPPSENRMSR